MKGGGAVLSNKPVVVDGRVITANGPSAAPEFADATLSTISDVEK
jgi:putative intracellular protease/amidase